MAPNPKPAKRDRRKKAPEPPAAPEAAAPAAAGTASGWTVEYLDENVLAESEEWPLPLQANLQRIIDRIEAVGLLKIPSDYRSQIRGKIWELRPDADGVEGRAFYVAVTGKRVVIVLCKIKKRRKASPDWIDLAEKRAKTLDAGDDK